MSRLPLLSIVTPSLDQARFLPRCLGSVADQGIEPSRVEHVIMDGGSTDGSREIIEAHARAHPRLVAAWRSAPDAGQSDAINAGFASAQGTWGAWLNADDWYEPGALARILAVLEGDGADIIVARCRFVDERGRVVFAPAAPDPITPEALLRLRSVWYAGRSLAQPEVFFKLDAFRRAGGLNVENHYSMDHELWVRMLLDGARARSIDLHVANLGVHAAQKTSRRLAAARCLVRFARPLADRLGTAGERARAEMDALARRLDDADRLITWWTPLARFACPEHHSPAVPGAHVRWIASAIAPARRRVMERSSLRVLHAAARSARAGREARIGVLSHEPEWLSALIRRALGRAQTTLHTAAEPGALPSGPLDILVAESLLTFASDPALTAAQAWSRIRPGGALVLLGEAAPTPALGPYLRHLIACVERRATADTDTIIDPRCDEGVRALLAHLPSDALHADRRSFAGVGVEEIMRSACPGARLLSDRRAGGLSFHPAAPFPCVGPRELAGRGACHDSAWLRPARRA